MGETEFRLSHLGEEWIGPKKDEFFEGVLQKIGYPMARIALVAMFKVRELPRPGQREGERFHATDDRLTELWVSNRVVATLLEIRDDFNYAQLLFADYLSPELIATIQKSLPEDLAE